MTDTELTALWIACATVTGGAIGFILGYTVARNNVRSYEMLYSDNLSRLLTASANDNDAAAKLESAAESIGWLKEEVDGALVAIRKTWA